MTCLFWFESVQTLQDAESIELMPSTKRIRRLNRNAVASQAFKKWVHGILSTTQVTQNVILLGLLFIYRLKAANPGVKGRAGSEYRLLTVALMLGNKCGQLFLPGYGSLLTLSQFSMIIPILTRRGPRSLVSLSRRSTSWRWNFSATCATACWCPRTSGRGG